MTHDVISYTYIGQSNGQTAHKSKNRESEGRQNGKQYKKHEARTKWMNVERQLLHIYDQWQQAVSLSPSLHEKCMHKWPIHQQQFAVKCPHERIIFRKRGQCGRKRKRDRERQGNGDSNNNRKIDVWIKYEKPHTMWNSNGHTHTAPIHQKPKAKKTEANSSRAHYVEKQKEIEWDENG